MSIPALATRRSFTGFAGKLPFSFLFIFRGIVSHLSSSKCQILIRAKLIYLLTCEENDQVGSQNLIGSVSHSNLLPNCDNPGKSREIPAVQAIPVYVPRKLLTMHRKLMVDIKRSRGALSKCKTIAQLDQESSKISAITRAHGNFISAIKELKDDDLLEDLSSDVTECLQKCSDLYHECRLRICDKSDDKTCEVSDASEE